MKKFISYIIMSSMVVVLCAGCVVNKENRKENSSEVLTIAYQYGSAYAPVLLMKEKKMIEDNYKKQTGQVLKVNWTQINSGADVNTGFASNNIDVGFLGVAPAITGCVNRVGYKIFTNVSGQNHGLMVNDKSINKIGDLLQSHHQIALVNVGSIQHIILSLALENQGYDPHALDTNIVAMKHPDGMNAIESGNVSAHLTTNPYLLKEKENASLKELDGISEVWTKNDSFVVGVLSEKLYKNNKEAFKAVKRALNSAINIINSDVEGTAEVTCDLNGNSLENEIKCINEGIYTTQTSGIFKLSKFMAKAGFIDESPEKIDDLVYKEVEGD